MMTKTKRATRLLRAGALVACVFLMSSCSLTEPVDISGLAHDAPDPNLRVVRLANVYEANHPANRCGAATMKEELAQHGIDLKVYPGAQLGTEAETIEQVATGALDMGISSGAFFGVWYPDSKVVDAPFLVSSSREYDRMTRGATLQKVYDDMAAQTGLRVFSSWYYGARNVTANKPVRKPEDFSGLKIRVPDAPLYLSMIRTFGGTGTPMALSEVYLGLQQGAIDAQENPIPTIASNKFQEVQSTVSLTRHIVQGIQLVTTDRFFAGLTQEERDAITHAADKARLANLECVEKEEQEILEKWKKEGEIEVIEDVDVDAFRQKVIEDMLPAEDFGDLYIELQQELESNTPTVFGTDPEDTQLGKEIDPDECQESGECS